MTARHIVATAPKPSGRAGLAVQCERNGDAPQPVGGKLTVGRVPLPSAIR